MKRAWLMALVLLLGVATMARAGILPKVMVVIDEKSLGTIATSEIEALAVKALAEKGIETVDQDMVAANLQRMRQALKQAGDGRGASALGREFGADVVLIGEAVVKPSAKRVADSNLRSYQAAVTLRAVRTDNAANLAAVSEDAAVVALEDVSGSARALRRRDAGNRQAAAAYACEMGQGNRRNRQPGRRTNRHHPGWCRPDLEAESLPRAVSRHGGA